MESVRALAEGKHPHPCQAPLILCTLIGGATDLLFSLKGNRIKPVRI